MTRTASSHQKPGEAWSRFPLRASRRRQTGQYLRSDCWLAFPGHVLSRDGQFLSASSPGSGLEHPPGRSPAHRCSGSCCQLPHETAAEISLEVPRLPSTLPTSYRKDLAHSFCSRSPPFRVQGERATSNCPPESTDPQTPTSSTRFAVLEPS